MGLLSLPGQAQPVADPCPKTAEELQVQLTRFVSSKERNIQDLFDVQRNSLLHTLLNCEKRKDLISFFSEPRIQACFGPIKKFAWQSSLARPEA